MSNTIILVMENSSQSDCAKYLRDSLSKELNIEFYEFMAEYNTDWIFIKEYEDYNLYYSSTIEEDGHEIIDYINSNIINPYLVLVETNSLYLANTLILLLSNKIKVLIDNDHGLIADKEKIKNFINSGKDWLICSNIKQRR